MQYRQQVKCSDPSEMLWGCIHLITQIPELLFGICDIRFAVSIVKW